MTYNKLINAAQDLVALIQLTEQSPAVALGKMAKARSWNKQTKALVHEIAFNLRVGRKHLAHTLALLRSGEYATQEKALKYGCRNLSARICQLRDMGYGIAAEKVNGEKIYWMP